MEIWTHILELVIDEDIPECHEHADAEICGWLRMKVRMPQKKTWLAVRRFAHISTTSRAAADKLLKVNKQASNAWGAPVSVFKVMKVLAAEWATFGFSAKVTRKGHRRLDVLAIGGSVFSGLDMRDHFTMLRVAVHHLRGLTWRGKGDIRVPHYTAMHRLLPEGGGRARLTAEIESLLRARKVMLTMPARSRSIAMDKEI